MTLCETCFSKQYWDLDDLFEPLLQSYETFWIGYLLCDPIPEKCESRANKYDLYVDEVKKMKFEGVKVLFNHNKTRTPLGEVKLTWHNHNIPNAPFAVGFLATIDTPKLSDTPIWKTLLDDTNASLSTLESDRSCVVELSLTYCGARDGCTGMIISKDNVKETVKKYGFPSAHYYKRGNNKDVNANYISQNMTDAPPENNNTPTSAEDVLKKLSQEDYNVMTKMIAKDQDTMKNLLAKYEESAKQNSNLSDVLGHYRDFLESMIASRIELEKNSTSDLAKKRRNDYEYLIKNGFLDNKTSDVQATKEMIDFCKNTFQDNQEYVHVEKFWNSFRDKFPDIHDQLPTDKTEVTVDAAFSMISKKMRDKDVSKIVGKSKSLEKKALDVARQEFHKVEKQREVNRNRNDTNKCLDQKGKTQNNTDMSFEAFLKNMGIQDESSSDSDSSPPPAKKMKKRHVDDKEADPDFLKYASEREKEISDMKTRFKSYKKDYRKHKKRQLEERQEQMDSFMKCIPSISRLAQFMDKIDRHHQAQENDGNQDEKETPMVVTESDVKLKQEKNIDGSALLKRDVPKQ